MAKATELKEQIEQYKTSKAQLEGKKFALS